MNPQRVAVALAVGCVALYVTRLRRQVLTWGAAETEAGCVLPGDELLPDADGVATRAITIRAPASAVWPWLAQMGPAPRGGAYTYDWIENLLGLNIHSADSVLPEFQHPKVGDTIGYGANRLRLERVEPEHVLAWRSKNGNWVWSFVLEETDASTRLISRNRFRLPRLVDRIGMIPMEPASLVMERKMLLGIQQRAERLAGSSGEPAQPQSHAAAQRASATARNRDQRSGGQAKLSDELQRWLRGSGEKTIGGLIELFGQKSFAILFVLLLGVSALPLPTGGVTHVFEIVAMLLALELMAGRDQIWLPQRWRGLQLAGEKRERFIGALMKLIRRLERLSHPRLRFLFHHRLTNVVFGALVIGGSLGAFLAPPFSGLDTLPSLGVVLLSLGVLLEDFIVIVVSLVVGAAGVVLEIVLGTAAIHGLGSLF